MKVTVRIERAAGSHDGSKGPLQCPGAEEHGFILGQPTEGGGGSETEEADDEHPTTTEVVGDSTTEEQETSESQRVRAHHPLTVRHRDVQGVLGRGQRHDHDRGVEDDHELGQGHHRQGPVPLGVGPVVVNRHRGDRVDHGHGGCLRVFVGLSSESISSERPLTLVFSSPSD